MDPFTQRMLERAKARQEKIDQKLANSGQIVPKRKPLTENVNSIKTDASSAKSPNKPSRQSIMSPRKSMKTESPVKSAKRTSSQKSEQAVVVAPPKVRNDVIVTKKEFKSPKRGSINRRNSDVSVEINISHRNDIQIEVQVEERDAPISVVYNPDADCGSNVIIKEIEDNTSRKMEKDAVDLSETKPEHGGLRQNFKSRLDRLGNLYSDNPNLSSPIHRTELEFTSATPPPLSDAIEPRPQGGKKKLGRLAALADRINNWEDDLTHHTFQPEPAKPPNANKPQYKKQQNNRLEESTLDVSINSFKDINKALQSTTTKSKQTSKAIDAHTFIKPHSNECQRLEKQIVAELEGEGYRRVSASQSRLVYDFATTENADPGRQEPKGASTTPSATAAPNMATMVASAPQSHPPIAKKPSLKKYQAPTPPSKVYDDDDEECESEKDKENNDVPPKEENGNSAGDCIQTKCERADDKPVYRGPASPTVKKLAPKLNGNVERSSVLTKAAIFEAGSPRSKEKDPAEMSLRERKALFEKNKGAAIVPKAPFGLAPSVKTLHSNKDNKSTRTLTQAATKKPTFGTHSRTNSKDSLQEDNVSQSSVGGIKGKLVALFTKEQTISETTIANKFKQERDKDMEMLQNRFPFKPNQNKPTQNNDSDEDHTDHDDPSEKAPLMGSTPNLVQSNKKPEIIANIPKVTFEDNTKSGTADDDKVIDKETDRVIATQPIKRRSSQDSPVVLSVLEDVKRIKVNNNKKESQTNGHVNGAAVVQQQPGLYPHLSDIETDTSNTQEEYSDCGGSRCGYYALECVFFFLCI